MVTSPVTLQADKNVDEDLLIIFEGDHHNDLATRASQSK